MPPADYPTLRDQIQGILTEGQSHTRQATEWERVETYWHIGDALLSHIAAQPRADYGRQVVPNLCKDIQLSESVLWDILRFRRLLSILPSRRELTFTHYRKLVRLPNQGQFRFYERLAHAEGWSVRQLEDAVRADAFTTATTQPLAVPLDEDPLADGPALRARFGPLYIYRVATNPAADDDRPRLDLGFHITSDIPLIGIKSPSPGALVTSHKQTDGSYTFNPVPARTNRYTYVAGIHRVIDGDTFVGAVDLGLGLQARDLRFRLRGIDTLELNTLAGRNARQFVGDALAQVDFVVVRTHRTDSFGRYLVDLRYLPGEPDPDVVRAKGVYLNRQLLEERLARRFMG